MKFLRHQPSSLVQLWQRRQAALTKSHAPALTPKQLGQLQALYGRTGRHTRQVVEFAFDNWPRITKRVTCQRLEVKPDDIGADALNAVNQLPLMATVGQHLAAEKIARAAQGLGAWVASELPECPTLPHSGFLLKWWRVVAQLMHEEHLLTDADIVWFAKTVWGIDV